MKKNLNDSHRQIMSGVDFFGWGGGVVHSEHVSPRDDDIHFHSLLDLEITNGLFGKTMFHGRPKFM